MPLLNPTQGIGLCFGSTIFKGTNVSARNVGYGQVLIADSYRGDADTTTSTPGTAGSAWLNWHDQNDLVGANLRRAPHAIAGIVMDNVLGGIPDNGTCFILVEGYPLCWVRRTAANAAAAIYDAAGSPLSLELNTTNVVRCLSSGISVVLAAGTPGPQKCIGICETAITAAVATIDAAEGATGFPMQPTGPAGTTFAMTGYTIQLADVLFDGVRGL